MKNSVLKNLFKLGLLIFGIFILGYMIFIWGGL